MASSGCTRSIAGVVLIAISPLVRKLMRGVH